MEHYRVWLSAFQRLLNMVIWKHWHWFNMILSFVN